MLTQLGTTEYIGVLQSLILKTSDDLMMVASIKLA